MFKKTKNKAFTLIEIMIALAIISLVIGSVSMIETKNIASTGSNANTTTAGTLNFDGLSLVRSIINKNKLTTKDEMACADPTNCDAGVYYIDEGTQELKECSSCQKDDTGVDCLPADQDLYCGDPGAKRVIDGKDFFQTIIVSDSCPGRCVKVVTTWKERDSYKSTVVKEPVYGPTTVAQTSQTDTFTEASGHSKVDLLWVVDNSGSMEDNQANIAANFSNFISNFVNQGIDYNIGITTVETTNSPTCYCPYSAWTCYYYQYCAFVDRTNPFSARNGRFVQGDGSSYSVIKSTFEKNLIIETFKKNIMVGTGGGGREKMLDAALLALEKAKNETSPNNGFLRDDANLAIILVSDENDQSVDSVEHYVNSIKNYKNSEATTTIYAITDTAQYLGEVTPASNQTINTAEFVPKFYIVGNPPGSPTEDTKGNSRDEQAAILTGGLVSNINSPSFSSDLVNIGKDIVASTGIYILNKTPVSNTISVKVDGANVNKGDSTNGWAYIPSRNAVVFFGESRLQPTQTVEITYDIKP